MHFIICGLLTAFLCAGSRALYTPSDDVVELTSANFKKDVLNDKSIWIVEFYAPWCGHCKNMAPAYKQAATALKGIVKVGAVDMTVHQDVGGPYNVKGFPTLKIFGGNKDYPTELNGRGAKEIVDAALKEASKVAADRLSGKGGKEGGGSKFGGSKGEGKVFELTAANFKETVLDDDAIWFISFFAPWCGHCKKLEPEWKDAASQLDGKIKMGTVDATVESSLAQQFGVSGYPTIKIFDKGVKDTNSAKPYEGGRSSSDIVKEGLAMFKQNKPAPEVKQLLKGEVLEKLCKDNQLCFVAFLPHILDCQSSCRNEYISLLKELAEKYKQFEYGYTWVEGMSQPEFEKAVGIGGFGYPAMIAMNTRKMKYATHKGNFGKESLNEFYRSFNGGRFRLSALAEMPKIIDSEAWDGKDGSLPEMEDIDLSDVDFDDEPTDKKTEL